MTTQAPPAQRKLISDDLAYVLPMAVWLLFIWVSTKGTETAAGNTAYPWAYAARTLTVAAMLILFWRHYTKIRWNHWWLGVIVGVIGIFQWVAMQQFLEKHFDLFRPSGTPFNPEQFFENHKLRWAFIAVRLAGAVLVVPIMEELFWRDYLWRQFIAPNDLKLANVGEWDWKALLFVSLLFGTVHANWWLTAIVWGSMVAALLLYTKSLGACIIAHATTNLLLGLWVLHTKQWSFW
jgi:CAAX prenyl protease-like protein